jgi:hypothetical protein
VAYRDKDVPIYRLFEEEWRQVFLLWIGRRDVKNELKNGFIQKLTNFHVQEKEFHHYHYRAYWMAAISLGEFESSQWARLVAQQLVEWAFGYFDPEKKEWMTYYEPIITIAEVAIHQSTNRDSIINALISLLENPDLDPGDIEHAEIFVRTLSFLSSHFTANRKIISFLIYHHNSHDLSSKSQKNPHHRNHQTLHPQKDPNPLAHPHSQYPQRLPPRPRELSKRHSERDRSLHRVRNNAVDSL